jgi:hypothetical protein
MQRPMALVALTCGLALGALGCGGSDPGTDHDSGHVGPGMDGGPIPGVDAYVPPRDGGSCTSAAECPGTYCNMGTHSCCVPATPSVERCGDHVDQDCDGHDASCGDQDGDTINACTPADTDLTMCDCNDSDRNTYPARPGLAGGAEACDGHDNDCDGRVDEAAACCPACMALGDATRGDVCSPSGECQCSTAPGGAVCPAGQACCSHGCVDTTTDLANCGSCGFACTNQSDRCVAGECSCGPPPGMTCACDQVCTAGTCGGGSCG